MSFAGVLGTCLLWHASASSGSAGGDPKVHDYSTNHIRFRFADKDARRVYFLLACDIGAADIGEAMKADLAHMSAYVAAMKDQFPDVKIEYQRLYPPDLTWTFIEKYYRDLRTTADDVLVFYYSGHGGTDVANLIGKPPGRALMDTQFFKISGGEKIFRTAVRKAMEAKPQRLVVLLSDCCSNRDKVNLPGQGIGTREVYALARVQVDQVEREANAATFRSLFLRCQGLVDMTAATMPLPTVREGKVVELSLGETAACNGELGSVFTHVLLRLLALTPAEMSQGSRYPNDRLVDWMQLFIKVQPATFYYRLGLEGSVLAGVDRRDHAAVVAKLQELGKHVQRSGSQRPVFYELRGE
jgi:hypothetical protein